MPLVNKFADSLVIGFSPLYFLHLGLSLVQVGFLVGVYRGAGGPGGAQGSDHGWDLPDRPAGIVMIIATGQPAIWFSGAAAMGVGMALVYPNLITAVGDPAHPAWRGGALGVYRLWRDGGYAVGPLVLGAAAVVGGISAAFWVAAGLVGASGVVLLLLLDETEPSRRTRVPPWERHPEWVAH